MYCIVIVSPSSPLTLLIILVSNAPTSLSPCFFKLSSISNFSSEYLNFVSEIFPTLREESSQTNVILQYKLLAEILTAVCSVIQQS